MSRRPNAMRVAAAAALPAYLAERGGTPARVLHEAGLVAADLREPQAWLDLDRLGALYEAAARELDDQTLGARFGLTIPLHAYGLISYVVLNAPTVRTALDNLVRFATHLAGAWEASLVVRGPLAGMRFDHAGERPDDYRQYVESNAAALCVMMKTLAGADWKPTEVYFRHGKGDSRRRPEVLFEAPLRFDQPANEIVISAALLDDIVVGADRTLLPLFEEQADAVIARAHDHSPAEPADELVTAVRGQIVRSLCDGQPSLARTARMLAMSPRTLQRELQGRGVRFKSLVNETRLQLAKEYLGRPELSITEVAFLLGYAELSAFDRAFRRAAGTSPRAWRKSL